MTYKLFIDDERYPPASWLDSTTIICRSSKEAIDCINERGLPEFISFDHDLGGDDTAMRVVNQLETLCCDYGMKFPESFAFTVHSQNPVGARNINHKMAALIDYFGE